MSKDAETIAEAAGSASARGAGLMRRALRRVSIWVETCASYYAASAIYQELARLSDAELARRGLSRDTLARDAAEAAERAKGED